MTDVWLGSVRVRSTTVRAFSVDAPCAISRWKVGAPAGPSWVIASGLRPSTDTWITCSMLSGGGGGDPAVQLPAAQSAAASNMARPLAVRAVGPAV